MVNDITVIGTATVNALQISTVKCDTLSAKSTNLAINGGSINITPTASLPINSPTITTTSTKFNNSTPNYSPTPLDYYEYYSVNVEWRYAGNNPSNPTYFFSYKAMNMTRVGRSVTISFETPFFILSNWSNLSEVWTVGAYIPERFRYSYPEHMSFITIRVNYPAQRIIPFKVINRRGQLVIQTETGGSISTSANEAFYVESSSISYVL